MRGAVLDPLGDPRWARLVAACPDALPFHGPAWLGLLHATYGYGMSAWCVLDGDEVVAGLPVAAVRSRLTGDRLVAVPFCDLCGPLVHPGAPAQAAPALWDEIERRRARSGLDLEIHAPAEGRAGAAVSGVFLHHVVALADDVAEVEGRFTSSMVLRNVRKARRLGLRTTRRTDAAALAAFCDLHVATRRHQGVPVQPRRFLTGLGALLRGGLGFVALVGHDGGPPAAAAVFLRQGDTLIYKYGASDRTRLRERPNNLLFSDVIRWACADGVRRLDLGRTDLGNPGLRDFKRSWGAAETRLSYTMLSDRVHRHRGEGAADRAMRAVLQRSPPAVARLTGEVLYRHFA